MLVFIFRYLILCCFIVEVMFVLFFNIMKYIILELRGVNNDRFVFFKVFFNFIKWLFVNYVEGER